MQEELNVRGFECAQIATGPAVRIMEQIPVLIGAARQKLRLQELLRKCSSQECADVRDQVYAHLSLADGCDGFDADYKIGSTKLFWKVLQLSGGSFARGDINRLQTTLSITAASLITEQDVEYLRAEACSMLVSQWEIVSSELFTRTFRQCPAGGGIGLQYHSFVMLNTDDTGSDSDDTETELSLALTISRELINSGDIVYARYERSTHLLRIPKKRHQIFHGGPCLPNHQH